MQYFTAALSLALLPSAFAAYGYGSSDDSSSSTTPSAQKAVSGVHIVKVAQNGGLTFEPNSLDVPVGESVEFHFWPKAHSVAQSSFAEPCQPLNQTAGFFSGPVAIASGMSPTVFRVTVNSTAPIWYYCATGQHCQGGMVGVINAPNNTQRTIETYAAAAQKADSNVTPASVKGGVLGAAAAAASGTTTGTSPSASSTGAAVRESVPWILMAGAVGAMFV